MSTFKELYKEAREKPTPAQAFLDKVSQITCREITTIRQWLSGAQEPTRLVKQQIAKAFDSTVEEMFPENEKGVEDEC